MAGRGAGTGRGRRAIALVRQGLRQAPAKLWLRQALPLALGLWLVALMGGRLGTLDAGLVRASVAAVPWPAWLLAAGFTAASFAAIALYDRVAAALLGLRIAPRAALATGFAATAIVQATGIGLVVGSLVRWRLLGPAGLGLERAVAMTGSVALGFFTGWAGLAALALLWLGPAAPVPRGLAWVALAAVAAMAVLAFRRPELRLGRFALRPPGLVALGTMATLAAADTAFAAAAFWVLIGPGEVGFGTLWAAYLLALGAGLLTGTPGGVGAFELVLLACLGSLDPAAVIGATLAFRLVYHALPALAGTLVLARGLGPAVAPAPVAEVLPAAAILAAPHRIRPLVARAARAEAALALAGDKDLLLSPQPVPAAWMLAEEGNSLIALSDPIGPAAGWPAALAALEALAARRMLRPCLYKCGAGMAGLARARGWGVHRLGQEAWLDPARHGTDGPERRELRRKLRQAARAGVEVAELPAGAPLPAALREVARDWAAAHGGERGFSMSVYDEARIAGPVLLARRGGRVEGFVTLWAGAEELGLDLMRQRRDAPDGTMHALIDAALGRAAADGVRRLSLAAVPFLLREAPATWAEHLVRLAWRHGNRWHGGAGLHRFKSAFRPDWEDRYLCAPGPGSALLGALALARRVRARPMR